MTRDRDDEAPLAGTAPLGEVVSGRLRAVGRTDGGGEPLPAVRLRREFKGLTVADLLRDEIVQRLPGQVRSAMHHLDRGDYAAADRAMPGEFAPVLLGPGHHARRRRTSAAVFVVGVCCAVVLAKWLFG